MVKIKRILRLLSAFFSKGPSYLILFVTSRCNARCKMCFNWQRQLGGEGSELTIDEIIRISKSFKNLLQLTVTGGEPFLRDDIPEIVKSFYMNSGARLITIPTNGFFSEKIERAVERILRECPSCLLNVCLSLDAVGGDHDDIRQLPGSFDRVLNTYQRLRKIKGRFNNFYIKVSTVLSGYNLESVEEIFDYVKDNLAVDDHELLLARGNMRDCTPDDVPVQKYKELLKRVEEQALRNLKRRRYQFSRIFYGLYRLMNRVVVETIEKNRMVYPCLAGRRLIEIYDNGIVVPCEILQVIQPEMDVSFGNIRDFNYDIGSVLQSSAAGEIIDYIKKKRCFCSFECAVLTNIVFNPCAYPRMLKSMITKKV